MCVNAAKGYAVPAVKEYADQTGQNPSNMNFLVVLTGSRAFTVPVWNWSYGHYGHYGHYAHAWLGPLRCIDWAASCCRLQESVGSHENLMKQDSIRFSCVIFVWGDGDSGSVVGTNPEEPPEPVLKRRKTWKTNEFFQTGLEAGRDGSVRCSRLKIGWRVTWIGSFWLDIYLLNLLVFTYVLGLLGCSLFAGCHYFILFHHPVFSVCLPSCLRDESSISNRHIWPSLFIFYTIFSSCNVCWGEIDQGGPSSCTYRPCSIWCRSRSSCDH